MLYFPAYLAVVHAACERAPMMYPPPTSDGQFYSPPESLAGNVVLMSLAIICSPHLFMFSRADVIKGTSVTVFLVCFPAIFLWNVPTVYPRVGRGSGWGGTRPPSSHSRGGCACACVCVCVCACARVRDSRCQQTLESMFQGDCCSMSPSEYTHQEIALHIKSLIIQR